MAHKVKFMNHSEKTIVLQATAVHLKRGINTTSFITILPVNLKLEIFLHAYHDVLQLVLGAVCQEWRDIVWNSPQLWDTVNIILSKERYDTQMIILKDWLERSVQCPLSITLRTGTMICADISICTCLLLLFAQSHRWEYINFCLPRRDIVEMIRKPGSLPLLQSLSLNIYFSDKYEEGPTDGHHLYYFSEAPLLRSVNLTGKRVSDIILPWKQLEILHYFYDDDNHFFTILEQAQNLVHCRFPSTVYHQLPNRIIQLPRLQSITLLDTQTLQIMDLPSLKSLCVGSQWTTIDIDVLVNFIRRSSCHITTLDIHAGRLIGTGNLETLMIETPSLLILHLALENTRYELPQRFIEALHPQYETPFLPNLEVLTYAGWTCFRYATLIDVVEQRWKKRSVEGHGLRDVYISAKNPIPGADDRVTLDKIQKLRDEGMDIFVSPGTRTLSKTSTPRGR